MTHRIPTTISRSWSGLALSLLMAVTYVHGAVADISSVKSFNIPPEPVPAALIKFSMQSGVQVSSSAAILEGKRSKGAVGVLVTRVALDRILADTGLHYEIVDRSTIAITDHSATDASTGRRINALRAPTDPKPRPLDSSDPPGNTANVGLATIIVTAQRVAEPENKVPISIAAYSRAAMDKRGIESIGDIANETPGVTFSTDGSRSQISIRGISSTVGAGTTGIYIDDTPIQVRNAGYTSTNVYPAVFDLKRVEILRGPQGTLFGSGSEGGTVRFITNEPSLSRYSVYGRSELAFTRNGDPSNEAGIAAGGPLVDGVLGFRISAYYRHNGGYINRIDPNTGITQDANANWTSTQSMSIAMTYAPTPHLQLTPSFFYQDIHANDANTFSCCWWRNLSDPSADRYVTGDLLGSPYTSRMSLPSLKVKYDFPSVTLVSNTSYTSMNDVAHPDYSEFLSRLVTGSPYPQSPSDYAFGNFIDSQRFFIEEVRLQSATADTRMRWVAGAFYQNNRQSDEELIAMPSFPALFLSSVGIPYLSVFGTALGPDNSVYTDIESIRDRQLAGFGQVDYKLLPKLTATVGVRVSSVKFEFNSQNAGPFAGDSTDSGSQSETAVTPKYGLSYQINDRNLVYVSAAKGFRPGGAERRAPSPCQPDLKALGLGSAPSTYKSDNVWSYELGAKNRLFHNRLNVNSSLYYIKWNGIQQQVNLPVCGQSLITNLGSATSKGFDIAVQAEVVRGVLANLSVGYTDASFDQTISAGGSHPLVVKGDSIGGVLFSPWQAAAGLEYDTVIQGYDSFIRADYEFHGAGPTHDPLRDPQLVGYDPTIPRNPSNSLVNLRTGVTWRDWEFSLFAHNLLDTHTTLTTIRQGVTPLYYGFAYQPRTVGARVIFRY